MGIALPWTKHLLAYSTCLSYASYKEEHDHHAKFDSEIEVFCMFCIRQFDATKNCQPILKA